MRRPKRRQRSGSNNLLDRADRDVVVPDIEIRGEFDRHAVEALQLEIRRLARRYGVDIGEIRFEEAAGSVSV